MLPQFLILLMLLPFMMGAVVIIAQDLWRKFIGWIIPASALKVVGRVEYRLPNDDELRAKILSSGRGPYHPSVMDWLNKFYVHQWIKVPFD